MSTKTINERAREVLTETEREVRLERAAREIRLYGPDEPDPEGLALHIRAVEIVGKTDYTADEYVVALAQADRERGEPTERVEPVDGVTADKRARQLLQSRGVFEPTYAQYLEALEKVSEGRRS